MWQVSLSREARKAITTLPRVAQERAFALIKELETMGPVRGDWPNYGKLTGEKHHCHIKKGKPTYVMVWAIIEHKTIEVIYVGTHERAPY
ncbi:MAG: type II toxin-antitoxin system RelE family toxin [Thermodesulfobacteriota bacterium]